MRSLDKGTRSLSMQSLKRGVPCKLLLLLRAYTGGLDDAFIFRGFNGSLVKSSPERTSPGEEFITYAQLSTILALWIGGVMGISSTEFLSLYGSPSIRSGSTSATSNAGIPLEL